MEIKTSGKSLSELQWMHNEIQPLLEATQNLKPEEDYKGLNWEVKQNKFNQIWKLDPVRL